MSWGRLPTVSRALVSLAFENRFNDLRKTILPHTVYGYLSDNPPNDPSAMAEFHLTQYTLAPAIIKLSANENLVIVNYHSKQLDPKLLQANQSGCHSGFRQRRSVVPGGSADDVVGPGRDLAGRIRLGSLDVSAAAALVAA